MYLPWYINTANDKRNDNRVRKDLVFVLEFFLSPSHQTEGHHHRHSLDPRRQRYVVHDPMPSICVRNGHKQLRSPPSLLTLVRIANPRKKMCWRWMQSEKRIIGRRHWRKCIRYHHSPSHIDKSYRVIKATPSPPRDEIRKKLEIEPKENNDKSTEQGAVRHFYLGKGGREIERSRGWLTFGNTIIFFYRNKKMKKNEGWNRQRQTIFDTHPTSTSITRIEI